MQTLKGVYEQETEENDEQNKKGKEKTADAQTNLCLFHPLQFLFRSFLLLPMRLVEEIRLPFGLSGLTVRPCLRVHSAV